MKKIIALALALIMALSMASVAFAAGTAAAEKDVEISGLTYNLGEVAPGTTIELMDSIAAPTKWFDGAKITKVDFTTGDLCGASLIDSVKITKEKDALRITVKESYTMAEETAKAVKGEVSFKLKGATEATTFYINLTVNNTVKGVIGDRKAASATLLAADEYGKNVVTVMDEDGGYVKFVEDELSGVVKMEKNEKAYLEFVALTDDEKDALDVIYGEDFEGIVETFKFATKAFKNDVAFQYDAWEEDPHYFYAFDGENLTAIDAVYDADEDVDNYVFTAAAEGIIVVSDVELVAAAEETKNPDTGANDVVGVAAALAVVSLVAAGAVSLKK